MGFTAGLKSLRGVFDAPVFKASRSELRAIHRPERERIDILEVIATLIMLYLFIPVCLAIRTRSYLENCVKQYCD